MKEKVVMILQDALKKKGIDATPKQIEEKLEIPPRYELGDYAFPCFSLGEKLHLEPHQIALTLREAIGTPSPTDFEDVTTAGPYINFFFNRTSLARKILWEAITQQRDYGKTSSLKGKKVVIEFSSPNSSKPLHIGHLRGTIIGNALANMYSFHSAEVKKLNYLGDWGTQFGLLLAGWDHFGHEEKFDKDPIGHMLELYVKANKNEGMKEEGREWFKRLEEGDKKATIYWRLFRERSIDEMQKIYDFFGVEFDEFAGEAEAQKMVNEVLQELDKKKLLTHSEGALGVDLKEEGLGFVILQKSDGTTIYAARDIAEALRRVNQYRFDEMIYEVGQEQTLHFQQLFTILKKAGYPWATQCKHVSHGLYVGEDKKRFRTREGDIPLLQEIIGETIEYAKEEIKKRTKKITKKELQFRAEAVARAAILYGDFKHAREGNVLFDPKAFVSFEGDTGPYLLYTYARASSIMRKAEKQTVTGDFEVSNLYDEEIKLVKKIYEFEEITLKALRDLAPSHIAQYAYTLAQLFNEFYHQHSVLDGEEKIAFRLALVESFRIVMKNALRLLGIETLEEM